MQIAATDPVVGDTLYASAVERSDTGSLQLPGVGLQRLGRSTTSFCLVLGLALTGWIAPSGATVPSVLEAALQRSIDARGFTLQVQNPAERVFYQAPNRTSTSTSNWFMIVAIGPCLYLKVSPTLWAKPSCTGNFGNVLAGRSLALGYLRVISDFPKFQRSGSTYTATMRTQNIPSVMAPVFGTSGTTRRTARGLDSSIPLLNLSPGGDHLTMKTSVVVRGGYVVSEQLSLTGPHGYSGRQLLTYSRYGSSPAVTAPPPSGG